MISQRVYIELVNTTAGKVYIAHLEQIELRDIEITPGNRVLIQLLNQNNTIGLRLDFRSIEKIAKEYAKDHKLQYVGLKE